MYNKRRVHPHTKSHKRFDCVNISIKIIIIYNLNKKVLVWGQMRRTVEKIATELGYLTSSYLLPPESIRLLITFRCNFACAGCSVRFAKKEDELKEKEWLKIAAELKSFLPPKTVIDITGGEPLVRKKALLKLIESLKKHFNEVNINSNGSLLDTKTVTELEKAGLNKFKLSFYSLEEKIHNKLRGSDFAYTGARKAIKLLKKSKIKNKISILITKENIVGIPDLISFLDKRKNIEIGLQALDESCHSEDSRNLKKNFLPLHLWPKESETKKLFRWLFRKENLSKVDNKKDFLKATRDYYLKPKSALRFRCFVGQRNFAIYPDGDLVFCYKLPPLGNLKKESLSLLLRGKNAKQQRAMIKGCKKYCRVSCHFARGIKELVLIK